MERKLSPVEIKAPKLDYDIHPLIQKRWSPRSFSPKSISGEQMNELLEAARWAASAFNEQPWQYIYALRDTSGFEKLWACLKPGNQPWTKSAAVLMVCMARKTNSKNGKPNPWAMHDLGMANAQLLLQAAHRDIYGHLMAGFDKRKLIEVLGLPEDVEPLCMGALGYLDDVEKLEEPYKTRELTPRNRKAVQEFSKQL